MGDRAVTVVWHLQPLAFSIAPDMSKVGRGLATAIPLRRTSIADIFPMKGGRSWLATEALQHLSGLVHAPKPDAPRPLRGTAAFLSEAELRVVCDGGRVA